MMIADKLKELREHKNMSQGDIEARTGLLRCYISRVEMKPLKVAPGWGSTGSDARTLDRFRRLLRRTSADDRKLLLFMAQKMSQRQKRTGT